MKRLQKIKLKALGYKEINVVSTEAMYTAYTNGNNTVFDFEESICRTEMKLKDDFNMILITEDEEDEQCKKLECRILTQDGKDKAYIKVGEFISKKIPHYTDKSLIVFYADREYAIYIRENDETVILKDMNPTISDFKSYINRGDFCVDKIRDFCNKNNFVEESKYRGNYIKGLYLFETA